jgi:hypothetical protein
MASIISAGTTSGTSLNLSGDTSGVLQLASNGSTTAVTIDTSQNVGIGTASPVRQLHINNSASGQPATFQMSTANTGGTTSDGFSMSIDGTSSEVNIIQRENAAMLLYTNDTERMRVNAGAPILCLAGGNTSATGTGIAFPATQSASSDANTLDDYEEGTWTPIIGGTGGQSGQSYATQSGTYRKIGGFVYVRFDVTLSTKGTITSTVTISGFPFAVSGTEDVGNAGGTIVYWAATATSWNMIGGHSSNGGTSMILYGTQGSGNSTTAALVTGDISNTTRLMGMAVYPSA